MGRQRLTVEQRFWRHVEKAEGDGCWLWIGAIDRTGYGRDPDLVAVVEELGSEVASGDLAKLDVVEIPDDVEWDIEEYDGIEWVSERHRRWS